MNLERIYLHSFQLLTQGEMLGLVKVDKGEVRLTEFGLKFQKTVQAKGQITERPAFQDRTFQDCPKIGFRF